jgi:hypothetical protein
LFFNVVAILNAIGLSGYVIHSYQGERKWLILLLAGFMATEKVGKNLLLTLTALG